MYTILNCNRKETKNDITVAVWLRMEKTFYQYSYIIDKTLQKHIDVKCVIFF